MLQFENTVQGIKKEGEKVVLTNPVTETPSGQDQQAVANVEYVNNKVNETLGDVEQTLSGL